MSEYDWIRDSKSIIEQIKNLGFVEGQDRLDMVRTIRFLLYALQRSVSGWAEWANNPEIMARFSLDELKEMSLNLAKLTQPFIEYDSKITMDTQRNFTRELETRNELKEKQKDKKDVFYIK